MNRISKANTILVAILTESGASFNEGGVEYVRNMIIESHPKLNDRSIIAMMGRTVYKPQQLYSLLEQNDEMFVVVSYDGGNRLSLYDVGGNSAILSGIRTCALTSPETTSWQMFSGQEREKYE